MGSQILALKVAAVIFLLVCALHILRLVFKLKITVGNFQFPVWCSVIGMLVTGLLGIWMLSVGG